METREEMVDRIQDVAAEHLDDCGGMDTAGPAILDALLPQVSTVAELHSAPLGSLVIDADGRPWVKRGWDWEGWARKRLGIKQLLEQGPLTVVWQP